MFQVKRIVVGVEMPAERPWNVSKLKRPSQLAVHHAFQVSNGGRMPVTLATVLPKTSVSQLNFREKHCNYYSVSMIALLGTLVRSGPEQVEIQRLSM